MGLPPVHIESIVAVTLVLWEGKGTLGKVDHTLLPDEFRVVGLIIHG
jgi:hypothetical protein